MTHPFNDEAVKAGMQTLFELPGFFDPPKAARKIVNDILSAAFASAREQGLARDGQAVSDLSKDCRAHITELEAALEVTRLAAQLLRTAILANDPTDELRIRCEDMIRDILSAAFKSARAFRRE